MSKINVSSLEQKSIDLLAMITYLEEDYNQTDAEDILKKGSLLSLIVSLKKQQSKAREDIALQMLKGKKQA